MALLHYGHLTINHAMYGTQDFYGSVALFALNYQPRTVRGLLHLYGSVALFTLNYQPRTVTCRTCMDLLHSLHLTITHAL